MGQPSPPETQRKSRTSEQRWPSRVLILPVPLSLLALATVHDTTRVWAGLMIAMSGLLGWIFTRDGRKPSFEAAVILLIAFGTLCLSALCFLPLTHHQRSILQPGLVEPVQSILALTETQSHVLAIHPYEASLAWGWAAASWPCVWVSPPSFAREDAHFDYPWHCVRQGPSWSPCTASNG